MWAIECIYRITLVLIMTQYSQCINVENSIRAYTSLITYVRILITNYGKNNTVKKICLPCLCIFLLVLIPTSVTYEVVDSSLAQVTSLSPVHQKTLLTLEAGLRGAKNKTIKKSLGVELVGEGVAAMQENLKNLQVLNVLLDNVPASGDNSSPFSGYMTFSDEVGRVLQIGFVVLRSADQVTVISLNPIFFGAPDIEVFIVPEDKLDASTTSAENNYSALYKNISSSSLKPGSYPAVRDKYIVAAFFKSMVPPGVVVGLKLDAVKEGLQGETSNNKYQIFDDGWIVAVTTIETNLVTNPVWAKITFKQDTQPNPDNDEYLIGLYRIGKI